MSVRCTIRYCIAIIGFLGLSSRVLAQNQTGGFKIIVNTSGQSGSPATQEAANSLPLPENAQFYLINCQFAENMASENIYLVPTTNTSCRATGRLNVRA